MAKKPIKIKYSITDPSWTSMPECERQSTLIMAHIGHLQPILSDLLPSMVLELREAVRSLEADLEKRVRRLRGEGKIKTVDCFTCDGMGQMCNICGESAASCACPENDRSTCEDCDGRCSTEIVP